MIRHILKKRAKHIHKNLCGHVLVIAGCGQMSGAAILTSRAVFRTGAGLVTMAYPALLAPIYRRVIFEALHIPLPATKTGTIIRVSKQLLLRKKNEYHAIVIGPGLPAQPVETRLLAMVLREFSCPIVVDAGALKIASQTNLIIKIIHKRRYPTILTPHEGEMARLIHHSRKFVHSRRRPLAQYYARLWNVVLVLKGYHTVIASPAGRVAINPSGGPALATAGTGDVLAGIIGTFAAQHPTLPFEAAAVGAYVHGLAGDLAERELGERSVIATDLLSLLPRVLTRLSA